MTKDTDRATVHVVDDDASVRRSLRRLLRSSGYEVEEYASAEEFLRPGRSAGPGCVILDVRMPRVNGPEMFEQMTRSGDLLPVIFLTAHGDVPSTVRAMRQGAIDFLLKPVDAETLLSAIETAIVRHAATLEVARTTAALAARLDRLTPREHEVLMYVVRGEPNKCIADALGISEKTVKVHRHSVMQKLNARSVAELVRIATGGLAPATGAVPPHATPARPASRPSA